MHAVQASHRGEVRPLRDGQEQNIFRHAAVAIRVFGEQVMSEDRQENKMNQPPPWLFDVDVAKQECRICLDKLTEQIGRLRQLVDDSDSFAPDALRVSFEEAIPDMSLAGRAVIARLQILAHIRAGTIIWRGDDPK
jgi:hypothetical protein